MLFRGTQDGRVLAYDFKTGKRIWETTIADPKRARSVPAAPIAHDGVVYIGNAGSDFKGGKGKMYALDAKTGKILWQFFMVPRVEGDVVRGPLGKSPLDASTWKNLPGIPISGGGLWTSFTLDTKTGLLYLPGGNPAPDFAIGVREGDNLYTDSVVVLDAKTGDYKNHFKLVPKDWHDWDVSNPPILIQDDGRQAGHGGHAQGWAPLRLRSRQQQRAVQGSCYPSRECRRNVFARRWKSISARAQSGAPNGTARPTFPRRT